MRQLRFYTPLQLTSLQEYDIPEESARHMVRVLRLAEGDEITLFNGDNYEYRARLIAVSKKRVRVFIVDKLLVDRESPLHTTLIQSLSKGDKIETTLQKTIELGVSEVYVVKTERSNVSLSGDRLEKKMLHWQSVARSACEQTGRNKIPDLHTVSPLFSILDQFKSSKALKFILSPYAALTLQDVKGCHKSVVLLIGPEGGLSENEVEYASNCGFVAVKAGPRILRTETAGPAILSIMQMLWGDLK